MPFRQLDLNPEPLIEEIAKKYTVVPSEMVYFDQYPYRVRFNKDFYDTNLQRVYLQRQIEDLDYDGATDGPLRTNIRPAHQFLYIRDYADLKTVLAIFGDTVTDISGPVDADHAKFLTKKDHFVAVRNKIYYNKYNCKMTIMVNRTAVDYFEEREFIKHNLESYRPLITTPHIASPYRDRVIWDEFYTDYEEMMEFLPFYFIAYPKSRMFIQKVVIKDKYN